MKPFSALTETSGRVVVITGAARGIGRAVAQALLAADYAIVAVDRTWEGETAFASTLQESERGLIVTADVSEPSDVARAFEATMRRFGHIDVLVNNAAMRQRDLFPPDGITAILETSTDDWRSMLGTNLLGTLSMTRTFIEPMLRQRAGSIVNVGTRGSVLRSLSPGVWRGEHPSFANQPYDASKAAMCSFSLYLAEEVRDRNVAVNVVFPGPTRTTGSEAIEAARRASNIDKRPFLKPEHLTPLVLHLANQAASSGETGLVIDALQWNRDRGFGDVDAWRADP